MIQMQTYLDVADNTGAKQVQCIKVLGGTHRRYASLGDIIVASVKKAIPGSDIRTGTVVKGVIVRVRQNTDRKSVVEGKRVIAGVDLGGRRIIKKKKALYLIRSRRGFALCFVFFQAEDGIRDSSR